MVGWEWRRARYVVRSGPDGADLALIDVIREERVNERFRHVVIGSGDGIFADVASLLGLAGVQVTAVSRPESLSSKLRLAARGHVLLPSLTIEHSVPMESA